MSHSVMPHHLLLYGSGRDLLNAREPDDLELCSGMFVRAGRHPISDVRDLRSRRPGVFLGVDAGAWHRTQATPDQPFDLPEDGLFPITLDMYADPIAHAGADVVLTPSRFVAKDDWASLKGVLAAARRTDREDVRTLVATDAAMLSGASFDQFVDYVGEGADGPIAIVFAAAGAPLASRLRLAALRRLVMMLPGVTILAADILVATDVLARGGIAACGLTSSVRRPSRPGDRGGPRSEDFIPGTFLRDLWETRNPRFYRQWYANRRSPTCPGCGDRPVDRFAQSPVEAQQIVDHNVHSWLAVDRALHAAGSIGSTAWLAGERRRALEAHIELRPVLALRDADSALQALCSLDAPQWWRELSSSL